jgi:hypothetical protein
MDSEDSFPAQNSQADIVSSQGDLNLAAPAQIEVATIRPEPLRFEPEFELLLACCGDDSRERSLAEFLTPSLHWDRVLRLADHHRLLPALYASVCNRDDLPGSIQSAIRARFEGHALRVLRFSAELARILQHFADREIQALAHKGPVLAHLLYGDAAMRQFGDLDFLVRARDVARARSALRELGYEPHLRLSPRQEKSYLGSGYEYVFGLSAEKNLVELQWQILPRFYSVEFDLDEIFQRSVEVEVQGARLRTLASEDLMLVLCVHAAKHEWAQLGMIRDMAAVARLEPDWLRIEAEARRLGILRILGISLLLAHNLFSSGARGSLEFLANGAEELASEIQFKLASGLEPENESLRHFRVMMRTRERLPDRMRLALRLAFTPGIGEWQTVNIPDWLFSLYRGVRMLRLARRVLLESRAMWPSIVEERPFRAASDTR